MAGAGARKRGAVAADKNDPGSGEPAPKRRSSRQASAAAAAAAETARKATDEAYSFEPKVPGAASKAVRRTPSSARPESAAKRTAVKAKTKVASKKGKEAKAKGKSPEPSRGRNSADADSADDDNDVDAIPAVNPEAPRHEGEWYWLMKAEPEPRLENGVDVSFSIDDLRAKTRPEGWDGIRAYAARNHMRTMNVGDKAFFYHSNCKEPGIVGIMEIVKEFSEDKSARRPGTPYYDPSSTKEAPRWSLVHVEFRRKFALPVTLRELRELGKLGGPLEAMQMLKQSRLSVSRVSSEEWAALCRLADEKAAEAGLDHDEGR
ncbi:hypothetical protein CDD83_10144 [Cordyceps sp. RAO-2017]|nr:hypothetical protein CDD83_10144 [Cordyceps sp. RAO-2017]